MGIELGALAAWAAVAGAAVTVYGQVEQGKQQKAAADFNAREHENAAAYENDAAVQRAAQIRKAARAQVGSANAQLAAQGVQVGEGSALEIGRTIYQNSEADVFNTLLSGGRALTSGQSQASLLRAGGANALSSSYIGAGSTILGSSERIASGWKNTKAPGKASG